MYICGQIQWRLTHGFWGVRVCTCRLYHRLTGYISVYPGMPVVQPIYSSATMAIAHGAFWLVRTGPDQSRTVQTVCVAQLSPYRMCTLCTVYKYWVTSWSMSILQEVTWYIWEASWKICRKSRGIIIRKRLSCHWPHAQCGGSQLYVTVLITNHWLYM